MSWFSENYEKAALGGAGVLALGLIYLGWSKYASIEESFPNPLTDKGSNETAVKDADLVSKASQSIIRARVWDREDADGREVDLFTGIPLFISRSAPDKIIDFDDSAGPEVHSGIKNTWWTANHIDPGFADSPHRDPDEDGFTNIEEYKASTDPNAKKDHPPLVYKLLYVKDESIGWVIRPGFGQDGGFPFKYEDGKGQTNSTPAGEVISPDGMFFAKGPQTNRFKLVGSEVRKEVNKSTQVEKEVTMVLIQDLRPNKKNLKPYAFPSPLQDDARKLPYVQYDRTAVFTLEALGGNGKQFQVEENTPFALPPEAATKDYIITKMTPESMTVEYPGPDKTRKTIEIQKGRLTDAP